MYNIEPVSTFFEHLPIPSFVMQDGYLKKANSKMSLVTDCSAGELVNAKFVEFIHPQDRTRITREVLDLTAQDSISKPLEFRVVTRQGRDLFVRCIFSHFELASQPALLGQVIDITRQKQLEESLLTSNFKYQEIIDALHEVVFEADLSGRITFANQSAYDFFGYARGALPDNFNVLQAILPAEHPRAKANIARILQGENLGLTEYTCLRQDGRQFPVIIHSVPLISNGQVSGIRGIIIDITERKRTEEKLKYLSLHDSLTGLFNRAYFEGELQRLNRTECKPLGVLVCDVDGLKLVNDTLGHDKGDRLLMAASRVIRSAFRNNDTLARIGGDEFAILLPNCTAQEIDDIHKRIYSNIADYNNGHPELLLSISVGYAHSDSNSDLTQLFKEADNNMYREKLHRKQSARSSIVITLLKALDERDFITQGHAERLQDLVLDVAVRISLPEQKLNDIRLFAQFHDIGKVGVPDHILFKPSRLTAEEIKKMQEHSEIGYRIAISAPDLAPIAHFILHHHEWWNGEGYPNRLKGEDIPLECRILAICDAFDAMTNDRPYRKALSKKQAVQEIRRCAGIQFDPNLVLSFMSVIKAGH